MNSLRTLTRSSFIQAALIVALLIALAVVSTVSAQTTTFRNPLNSSGPDPWMTYYNGNYYLAATTWGGASTGLTMRKASTIAGLKTANPVQIWQDSTASRCCNYWAPEFFLLNGPNGLRWYGYFTGGATGTNYTANQHIHVIESTGTDPMGPYTYKAQLISRAALDGSVMTLNGTMYAIYSVWNTKQEVAIKQMSNPWTTTGSEVVIASPSLSWEIQDGNVAEGPVAIQRNGKTYIIYSASACWGPNYKLGQLTYTGTNPLSVSSWTKKSTAVFQQSAANSVYGPGHNNFFKSPDGTEDWIIYHANSSSSGACDMNRTPRIQKFTWNADDTPNFGIPASTSTDLSVPSGESGVVPTPTKTNTPVGPTPTRTNTPTSGPTLTPTRTPTPGATTNLAQGKTASADSVQTANPVANGNDGSATTRWCAADANLNHWWKVDLGVSRALTGSEVMWEKSGVVYKYKVEVSADNSTWTTVIDKTANTSTAQTQTDAFSATARYVRITVTGLATSTWASFFEFRVFGN